MIMIKYGKEEHLKQIVKGKIRFAPTEDYIKIEKLNHNKGQGDLLEGKMKINNAEIVISDFSTGEPVYHIKDITSIIGTEDTSNMPVFCLSCYEDDYMIKKTSGDFIKLKKQYIDCIENDFPESTHALIILEPDKFTNDVISISGHSIIGDNVRYYDYNINTLQMLIFLTTGNEKIQTYGKYTMFYKDRYRHLLCKDKNFKEQKEYRFIILDELIDRPNFYSFEFTSRFLIVPIQSLREGVKLEI